MQRKLLINIHLYLAAFFSPLVIITAISGGLYLIDEKGFTEENEIYSGNISEYDFDATDKENQVQQFLSKHNIKHDFEYIKGNSTSSYTRPTSRPHLLFKKEKNKLVVVKRTPNFVAAIIELHKGHGPRAFKTFQKIMAVGLLLILISGLILGLTSNLLRRKTLVISSVGLASFLFFVFF